MLVTQLPIEGALVLTPVVHRDGRGSLSEWFRADVLEQATGHRFRIAQANCSVSAAGTIRGVHFAEVPPGQAKYVTCSRGEVLDVVVDLRVGSPTYGTWEAVRLDDRARAAVYLPEGLGHAFMALQPGSVVTYLCSAPYTPRREHGVNPLDPALAIEWPTTGLHGAPIEHLLSPKDTAAPTLSEAAAAGLLPTLEATQAWRESLRGEAGFH